jgi:ankyrin repeat protein
MIDWLLQHNADPSLVGGKYGSPTSAALHRDSRNTEAIVKALVESGGANVNYLIDEWISVLRLAWNQRLISVLQLLLCRGATTDGEWPAGEPLVLDAAGTGQLKMLEALFKYQKNLLGRDRFGQHLLSIAIGVSREDTIKFLLNHKVYTDEIVINTIDNEDRTSLMLCVLKPECSINEAAFKRTGPDLDMRDCEGKTALAYACILDIKLSVISMLKSGANLIVRDNRDHTPLYWACRWSSIDVVQEAEDLAGLVGLAR